MDLSVLVIGGNVFSFSILSVSIKNFTVLIQEEFTVGELEELVPGTVGSIRVEPAVSDIKRVAVVTLTSDGSGSIVEVEVLCWSSISGLDHKSVGDMIQESSTRQSSLDMEWSVNVHSPALGVS